MSIPTRLLNIPIFSVPMGVSVEAPSPAPHGIYCSQRRGTDAVVGNELLEGWCHFL